MKKVIVKYKGIQINNTTLEIKLISESSNKDDVDLDVYLDKCDEPSPDKCNVYTWLTIPFYKIEE